MAEHTFSNEFVEEFYNAFHDRNTGRFTFKRGGKRGKIHVPFSEASRKSYAILKGLAANRKSKEYQATKRKIHETKSQKVRAKLPGKFEAKGKKTTEDIRPTSEVQKLTAKYGGRQK